MKTLLLLLAACALCSAQDPTTAPPPLADIISRMQTMNDARTTALRQYRSTRTYQVSYKGFPKDTSATAVVRVDFTAPDQKRFEIVRQEGSKLLINRVIKKALASEQEAGKPEFRQRSALNETNYRFRFLEISTENERPCFLLQVTPRRGDKYLYDGQICVDAADYAVARIDAKPAKNPSFWISRAQIISRNHKLGDFWLPATTRSTSHVRLGGDAILNIDYTDYQVIVPPSPITLSSSPPLIISEKLL
ncbi:MAG: hypothetical protein ACXVZX_14775 [Terriglobales bacterium]